MTSDPIDMLRRMGDAGQQQLRELTELNLRTWNETAGQQLALFGKLWNSGMRQAGTLAADPARLMEQQIDFSRELSESLAECSREGVSRATRIGQDYRELFETGARRFARAYEDDPTPTKEA